MHTKQIIAAILAVAALGVVIYIFANRTPSPQGGGTATTTATSTGPVSLERQQQASDLAAKGVTAYRNGDYQAARDYWEQAIEIYPEHTNSLVNLGSLYKVELKDYAKAEQYLTKAASSVVPGYSAAVYQLLIDFYRETEYKKDTPVYENTLKSAIARNGSAVQFRVLLARYYKDAGRVGEAKAQYDAAIAKARELGNASLAAQLEAEKSSF